MAKKITIVGLIILSAIALFFVFYPYNRKSHSQKMTGTRYIQFAELTENILAQSGEIKILKDEINDKTLLAYEKDHEELMIASAFKQFALNTENNEKVIFYSKKPERSLEDILIRYNAKPKSSVSIQFVQPKDETFIQIGDSKYAKKDISKTDFMWGAYKSKVFQRTIEVVIRLMVRKAIIGEAVSKKMSTEEFIEKSILNGEKNKETPRQVQAVEDYVLNNLLELPIKINVEVPDFQYEIKPDWTPSIGDLQSEVKVLVFSDFFSIPGRLLLESMMKLSKMYPQVYFGLRPFFPIGDRYQKMLAEYSFCVRQYNKEKFWEFILDASKLSKEKLESELDRLSKEHSMNDDSIKNCFIKQDYKAIVDYHLKYGQYLGINYGPVVFIDGEVLEGVINEERIDKVLKRKTWLRENKSN